MSAGIITRSDVASPCARQWTDTGAFSGSSPTTFNSQSTFVLQIPILVEEEEEEKGAVDLDEIIVEKEDDAAARDGRGRARSARPRSTSAAGGGPTLQTTRTRGKRTMGPRTKMLYMYQGDRWNQGGPGSVGNASYVWLPLIPTSNTTTTTTPAATTTTTTTKVGSGSGSGSFSMDWHDKWRIGDFAF